MRLHRQRKSGKRRAQQFQLLVVEAAGTIGGEGIDDALAVRGVAMLAECVHRTHVVRRAGGVKFDQRGKVAVFRPEFQATTQPGIGLARLRPHYDGIERAAQPLLRLAASPRKLLVMDGIQVASPSVAVAAPLRMQGLGGDIGPHQRETGDHETLAIAVEQIARRRAAQPRLHRPDVQIDDAPGERIFEPVKSRMFLMRRLAFGGHRHHPFAPVLFFDFVVGGAMKAPGLHGASRPFRQDWLGARRRDGGRLTIRRRP